MDVYGVASVTAGHSGNEESEREGEQYQQYCFHWNESVLFLSTKFRMFYWLRPTFYTFTSIQLDFREMQQN